MALFEPISRRGPRLTDPALPAVAAGGFDYVYQAATSASVPGEASWHRVPLAVTTYPVKTFYEATPSLSTTAYLKARVDNASDRPLLAGPANIFVGDGFAGQGKLATTGPGGVIELPLGADEDIRIVRKVVPSSRTEGVFSKDDITAYAVTIEVGNYKNKPIDIEIVDQVPKTNNEDIKIALSKLAPKPVAPPDSQGILRWKLSIPAKKTRSINFEYTLERPSGWVLRQR